MITKQLLLKFDSDLGLIGRSFIKATKVSFTCCYIRQTNQTFQIFIIPISVKRQDVSKSRSHSGMELLSVGHFHAPCELYFCDLAGQIFTGDIC